MAEDPSPPSLDDLTELRGIDASNMLTLADEFPTQCQKAWEIAKSAEIIVERVPKNVVVTGLGGSAIGGDLVRVTFEDRLSVPVSTNRDYSLPHFVNADSLVIAASYSGNTEETLSAAEDARQRGAMVVSLTGGGKLAEWSRAYGYSVITIPSGQPPRTATGYMMLPQLRILQIAGVLEDPQPDVAECIEVLAADQTKYSPMVPLESNPAKDLAKKLFGRIPIIYGATAWAGVVATRWKCQINENCKIHAFANVFPELSHNEILAWEKARTQCEGFIVVNLRDRSESAKIKKRLEVTQTLIGEQAEALDIYANGVSPLSRALSSMYLGDFASIYLALLARTDPTTIRGIDLLKSELAKVPS